MPIDISDIINPFNQELNSTSNVSFASLFCTGDLNVRGDIIHRGSNIILETITLEIADNIIVLNKSEIGAGITAGFSGIDFERGTLNNYRFGFDETTDLLKAGEVGSLKALAFVEDAPIDTTFLYYDAATKTFKTDTNIKRVSSGYITTNLIRAVNNVYTPKICPISGSTDLILGQLSTGKSILFGRNVGSTFEEQIRFNDTGDIELNSNTQFLYYGNKNEANSWRIGIVSNAFVIQVYNGSTYNTVTNYAQ